MTAPGSGPDRQLMRSAGELDDDTLRWALDVARFVRHPVFFGTVFTSLLVVAGVSVMVVSGLGVNDQFYVSLQSPYLISGGFGGLGLMIAGAVLASILGHRRDNALADEEMRDVLTELTVVSRLAVRRRTGGTAS